MKALFGVVSLLLVLAVVGMVGVRQLRAVGHAGPPPSAATVGVPAVPQMSGSGTLSQQSVELQNKVADDVAKAMNQDAQRVQDADKP